MKIVAALLLLATPALADDIEVVPTCVAIDVEHDALTEADRADARQRLERALELQNQLVVTAGCQDTITLWHERDGDGVIVHMRNALGARKLRVPLAADMFATYTRIARALYEPPPVAVDAPPARTAVYEVPDGNLVTGTTSAWQYRVGFGALGDAGAAAFAIGYRYGSNKTVAEISLRLMNSEEAHRSATSLRGQVLSYTRPEAVTSMYWGGGASFTSAEIEMEGSGSGPQLEGTLGLEWNRDGRWRYSIEGNVGVPFFTAGQRYPASFAISFGISH